MSDDKQLLGNNLDPLDHDGDGKKGGSPKGAASTRARGKKKAEGMPGRTWIVLEENDDIPPTGLPVSHNGNAYVIKAGEPVEVPEHILEILDHAVMSAPQVDPQTKRVVGYRQRMRFPYRKVAAPVVD